MGPVDVEKPRQLDRRSDWFHDHQQKVLQWHSAASLSLCRLHMQFCNYLSANLNFGHMLFLMSVSALKISQYHCQQLVWCVDPFYRKRPISRSVSHAQIFEYIDDRLRVAYCYFAMLPSQHADLKQRLTSNVPLESCDGMKQEQSHIAESVTARDYEFIERALVDKKVSCCGIW